MIEICHSITFFLECTMRVLLISLLALISFQTFGEVQEYQLKNGLKILVQEDHRAPVAVTMVWYNIGSADEPGGITGVSHALEHLMFKGTKKYPLGFFSKIIASIGGQENAFTSNDYTAYFEKIAASNLETTFDLESDRMQKLLFNPVEFSKEMKVIQEERRLRTDDNPQALTMERFLAEAHLAAPYHHPIIGWMSDIKQLQLEDAATWYQQFYAPNNATLVVVGDVKGDDVYTLAKKYFNDITPRPQKKRKLQQEPRRLGKKEIEVHANAQFPSVILGYTAPSSKTTLPQDTYEPYALELLAGILDAGESSRLEQQLIKQKHIANQVVVQYNPYTRYQTQFIIYATLAQNHTMEELNSAIHAEIDKLINSPVSAQELQRIKTQIIAEKTFEKDSIFSQAMELGLLETIGLGWKEANQYIPKINAVTAAQIQKTAKRYFTENNLTIAYLKPKQPLQPTGVKR